MAGGGRWRVAIACLRWALGGTAAALLLAAGPVGASGAAIEPAYPSRPIRMIVPFAPGGISDVFARVIAPRLTESLGQQIVIDNRAGAGGNIGMGIAAKAPADGYTVIVVTGSFVVNPSLYSKVPYDPLKDCAPVTYAAGTPNSLYAHPSVVATTVKELIALVKTQPGKFNYASPGTGTTPQLAGELFKLTFGLDLAHIPYNGAAPAVTAVLGNQVPIGSSSLPPAQPHIKAGTLRGLALLGAKRSPAIPDVPTIAEAGYPGLESDTLQGVLALSGTPRTIVARLNREMVQVLRLPDVKERLAGLGFEPVGNSLDQFAAQIRSEISRWETVVRNAHLKAD